MVVVMSIFMKARRRHSNTTPAGHGVCDGGRAKKNVARFASKDRLI